VQKKQKKQKKRKINETLNDDSDTDEDVSLNSLLQKSTKKYGD